MTLVTYSDSEASDDEQQPASTRAAAPAPPKPQTYHKVVDKSNPRKIQVNLSDNKPESAQPDEYSEQPPLKRARIGGGAFGGFNSLLPAPKRQTVERKAAGNGAPRKVFSLKTGAEPGFDREGDAELKALFAEEQANSSTLAALNSHKRQSPTNIHDANPLANASNPANRPNGSSAPIFKPLSVTRKSKKKGASNISASQTKPATVTGPEEYQNQSGPLQPAPKLSLFSLGGAAPQATSMSGGDKPYEPMMEGREGPDQQDYEDERDADKPESYDPQDGAKLGVPESLDNPQGTQSLDSIASDLNLSESARRQLFGRHGSKSVANAVNVVNFNTDDEYAANEALRASGEQVQHNPVRAIAPGKHSLRQLVTAASGQRDALEESFASGRRNKREAGNKYGW